ncbi:MAG: hypothetical protein LBN95_11825 [Prevotellaceae bacterium]|jgi:ATP phosphoribosyltransferase|nr:hypothetical protein [Prevotellaceae bacterium]
MLKLAIPHERAHIEKCLRYIQAAGVDFPAKNDFKALISNKFPVEVRQMGIEEIIASILGEMQDVGVVMQHQILENSVNVKKVHSFTACKKNVTLFIPNELRYKSIESLTGKRIATPFPNIVSAFLRGKNIKASIVPVKANVMYATEIGLADAVCTVVDAENATFCPQLREIEVVMQTFPVIVASENLSAQKQIILDDLVEKIVSVQNAEHKKMIYIYAPIYKKDAVYKALEQSETSVIELPAGDKTVFQCLMDEKLFWDIKNHLQIIGVENMLVMPVENILKD